MSGTDHVQQGGGLPRPVAGGEEPRAGAARGIGRQPRPLRPDGGAKLVEIIRGDGHLRGKPLLLDDAGGEGQVLLGGEVERASV